MKILFVDDYEDIAEHLCQGMTKFGHETFYSKSPYDALQKIKTINPDMVVSDVRMPEMLGFAFCKEVQKDHNIPFLFLTAYSYDKELLKGLNTIGFFEKPCSFIELNDKITSIKEGAIC